MNGPAVNQAMFGGGRTNKPNASSRAKPCTFTGIAAAERIGVVPMTTTADETAGECRELQSRQCEPVFLESGLENGALGNAS